MNENDTRPIMVTIQCLAYNHEPYIRQCLEGFVMQKTNFRFEVIVHDDASTDKTAEIIKEYAEKYPDIIKPFCETENQYSKRDGSIERFMNEHVHGKYVALCEGDDFWIDANKLQKQLDILESNPQISLCYTKSKIFIQNKGCFSDNILCDNGPVDFDSMLFQEPAITLTSFMRTDLYKKYFEEIRPQEKKWMMGDTPLWLWMANNGRIELLQDITAVYRMSEESASHSKNIDYLLKFNESTMDIHCFFCIKYQRDDLLPEIKKHYHKSNMRDASQHGCFMVYLRNFYQLGNLSIKDLKKLSKDIVKIILFKLGLR